MSLQVLKDAYNQHRKTRNCSQKINLWRELFIMFGDFYIALTEVINKPNYYFFSFSMSISSIIIHFHLQYTCDFPKCQSFLLKQLKNISCLSNQTGTAASQHIFVNDNVDSYTTQCGTGSLCTYFDNLSWSWILR